MTTYSYSQLEGFWIQAGGSKALAPLMAAIAEAESQGNSGAINPNDNGGLQSSWGLWQISLGNHMPPSPNWANPLVNAKLAVQKYQTQGLSAWGTYTSGKYKKYLNGKVPANLNTGGGGNVQTTAASTSGFSLTNPNSWTQAIGNSLLRAFGVPSAKDLFIRGGLILLGAILLIVGVLVLAGRSVAQTAVTVAAPEATAGRVAAARATEAAA